MPCSAIIREKIAKWGKIEVLYNVVGILTQTYYYYYLEGGGKTE